MTWFEWFGRASLVLASVVFILSLVMLVLWQIRMIYRFGRRLDEERRMKRYNTCCPGLIPSSRRPSTGTEFATSSPRQSTRPRTEPVSVADERMPEHAGVADVFGSCLDSWCLHWPRRCRTPGASDLHGSTEPRVIDSCGDGTQLVRS